MDRERVREGSPGGFGDEVIRLEGVERRYASPVGEIRALRGIDLSVPRGVIQGVIGSSGAGKSTLVRCLGGVERPDSGRVLLEGTDIARLTGKALREEQRKIGMVFQQFNLLRSRTVEENVALPMEIAGRRGPETRARVLELLDWVGLADRARTHPSRLSGGQRQRVAIARALANRPNLLLGDEPTSALDAATTRSVLDLLRRVRDELSVTILLITHQLQVVREICDRVAVIDAGRIVEEGPVDEVLAAPRSDAARRLLDAPEGEAPSASRWTPPAGWELLRVDLHFTGSSGEEPLITEIIRRHGVTVNILAGQIDQGPRRTSAWMRAEIAGLPEPIRDGIEHLRSHGVRVTPVSAIAPLDPVDPDRPGNDAGEEGP